MKQLLLICIGLIISFPTSVLADGMHHHKAIHVKDVANAPTVKLEVLKDTAKGWNVHLVTTNFKFTPENVNKAHIEGEGHAHLFINKKKMRIYSPYFHIMSLPQGSNTIRVTLNANNHADYMVQMKKVESMVIVDN